MNLEQYTIVLLQVKCTALDENQPEGPILNKLEGNAIFGNFEDIHAIHHSLLKQFEYDFEQWNNDTTMSMKEFVKIVSMLST